MLVSEPLNFEPPPPPGTPVFIYQEDHTTLIAWGQTALEDIHSLQGINVTGCLCSWSCDCNSPEPHFIILWIHAIYDCLQKKVRFKPTLCLHHQHQRNCLSWYHLLILIYLLILLSSLWILDLTPLNLPTCIRQISFWRSGSFWCWGVQSNLATSWNTSLATSEEKPSSILKDVFYVFHMLHLTKNHGLVAQFSRSLWDILFLPDPENKHNIENCLSWQSQPLTWYQCLWRHPRFIKCHCKHLIPPVELLYPLVAKLFKTYGPLKDAQSGLPLFNADAWRLCRVFSRWSKMNSFLICQIFPFTIVLVSSRIRASCLLLLVGNQLHWRWCTSPIRCSILINGVSPEHTYTQLKAYQFHHNMLVGTYNMTWQRYHGHFDLWLINELHEF